MIVSCAFREPYVTHSNKQWDALQGFDKMRYVNELPYHEGIVTNNIIERFQKSLYGFKPHAIQKAIDVWQTKVIWFDPSVYPLESVQTIYNQLENDSMLIIKGHNNIKDMTSQRVLSMFNEYDVNHIGGTIYAFNFDDSKVLSCFNQWKQCERDGLFGNQDEFMAGHWADESLMALCMASNGIEQKQLKFKYRNQKND